MPIVRTAVRLSVCVLLASGFCRNGYASEGDAPAIEIQLPTSGPALEAEITRTVGDVLQALQKDLTRLAYGNVFDGIAILAMTDGQPLIGLPDRTLTIGLPYDENRGIFEDPKRAIPFIKRELRKLADSLKLPSRPGPPPAWLSLTSMTVSLIPVVGEVYGGLSVLAARDLITLEKMSSLEIGIVLGGLAAGVGVGMVARKLYKARVVVFSQLAYDPHGANQATLTGLRAVARGGDEAGLGLANAIRSRTWRLRFKFVDLKVITPTEATALVKKELQNGRTVILNAHGDWDGIYLGSSIPGIRGTTAAEINQELMEAAQGSIVRNEELVQSFGRNTASSVFDGSCFSSTRRTAWQRIVGPRGRVLTLETRGASNYEDVVELTPAFVEGRLSPTTHTFFNDLPFATYAHGSGVH